MLLIIRPHKKFQFQLIQRLIYHLKINRYVHTARKYLQNTYPKKEWCLEYKKKKIPTIKGKKKKKTQLKMGRRFEQRKVFKELNIISHQASAH